jgi:pimeloyl-ACP methyl ester carboxylesterase
MRVQRLSLAVGGLAALVACADSTSTAPLTRPDLAPSASVTSVTEPTSGPWARIVEGKTGPGSLYAIYIPREPNLSRDAVFYAHGFRDVTEPVNLGNQDKFFEIRQRLGEMGVAVAYSSYSVNGFAVKDGAQRTHQLRGLLASQLGGQPGRSFLMGHSLGGGIALYLAERYPDQYDGAVVMCGMVGGSLVQTQYLGNVRALFDFFYPGKLTGGVLTPPETPVTIPQVGAAVASNPLALFAIASTVQTPLPFVPIGSPTDPSSVAFQTMVGSLFGALSFHGRGIENILDLTNGHSPFDNSTTTYALGANPVLPAAVLQPMLDAANAGVARFTFDPAAQNYLERHFTPTGDLRIPVLTLHNVWDPGVPAFHEVELRRAVEAAGAGAKLLQRFKPTFGHCDISRDEAVQSYQTLVDWVTSGQKPAS